MDSKDNLWKRFENFLGYQLPELVKHSLEKSAFDNELALSQLSAETLLEIEEYVSQESPNFKFLPGHRALLLSLPSKIHQYSIWKQKYTPSTTDILESPNVSFIMKELVRTSLSNCNVDPKRRRYSDSIKNFAMYLYMMCGKAAYEVLSNNLPFPQSSSICEFI